MLRAILSNCFSLFMLSDTQYCIPSNILVRAFTKSILVCCNAEELINNASHGKHVMILFRLYSVRIKLQKDSVRFTKRITVSLLLFIHKSADSLSNF